MPNWSDFINEFNSLKANSQEELELVRLAWIESKFTHYTKELSNLRSGRNVIVYASAFLQKPTANDYDLIINHEDLNGFMTNVNGLDCSKGLTLILHTPGGVTNSTETIVDYLREKFGNYEVIVPTFAMSAGTMISLSAEQIVMGRQSQLGPIDPQMPVQGRMASALAIVDQFKMAREEILHNPNSAHLWAPVLGQLGPSLLQDALDVTEYSKQIVKKWLETGMLSDSDNPSELAQSVANHFNDGHADQEKRIRNHGRRIDRNEAIEAGVKVEFLESSDELQDAVLSLYHILTIVFDNSAIAKVIMNQEGRVYLKHAAQ